MVKRAGLYEKERYLVFEIISEGRIELGKFIKEFERSYLSLLGEFWAAKAGILVVKDRWNKEKQQGLIRCYVRYTDVVRAALTLIRDIGGAEVIIRVLGISGTIKKACKKWIK